MARPVLRCRGAGGREAAQSASGSRRPDRACLLLIAAVPPCLQRIQHIPFSAVTDHDGGDWRRRISPGQASAINNFSAGYPSFKEEGAVSGGEIPGRLYRNRIAIAINLVRLRAT